MVLCRHPPCKLLAATGTGIANILCNVHRLMVAIQDVQCPTSLLSFLLKALQGVENLDLMVPPI